MKKIVLFIATMLTTLSFGQVVTDDLVWVPAGQYTSQTSPNFNFCNDTEVNYTISTTAPAGFQQAQNGMTGIIMPAITSNTTTTMPFTFTFSQEVCNLKIHFVDFDENVQSNNPITQAEEYLSAISPAFTSVSSTSGTLYAAAGNTEATPYDGDNNFDNDNVSGWVEWDVTLSSIAFTLNRPSGGYGVIIDSISFECCDTGCECGAQIDYVSGSGITAAGEQDVVLAINTQGELVTSLCIDVPFYQSLADDECLKCDNVNVESFGAIVAASPLNGVSGTLADPFGQGHSRKICYEFTTPTAINTTLDIRMQFPPVLELSCCKNDARYCYDVTLRKDDCTSCEYRVCSPDENLQQNPKEKSNQNVNNSQNDEIEKFVYNDFVDDETLKIFPNPAEKNVTIEFVDEDFTNAELSLFDPSGSLLKTTLIDSRKWTFDVSNLAAGTYLVSVVVDGQKMSRLLIVQ